MFLPLLTLTVALSPSLALPGLPSTGSIPAEEVPNRLLPSSELNQNKFFTRPDLHSYNIRLEGLGSPGYTLFTPCELVQQPERKYVCSNAIVDNEGHIVYVGPSKNMVGNFQKQKVGRKEVLSYWDGILKPSAGFGDGVHRVMDDSYKEIGNFTVAPGLVTDVHEFIIQGTSMLVIVYEVIRRDLRYVGGVEDGYVLNARLQKVDMITKKVLFDWSAIDHFDPSVSLWPVTQEAYPGQGTAYRPWDYFHINSVDPHPYDGSVLISSRHTSALYKLNGTTGDVIWILGGRSSGFAMWPETRFSFQHDARWVIGSDDEVSVFDNAELPPGDSSERKSSRGLILKLDAARMECTVKQQFLNPAEPKSEQGGSMRVLPSGNAFVSYGFVPLASEFAPNGTLLSQMWWADGIREHELFSYRMLKTNWTGQPTTRPDIAIDDDTLYVSWNGATEVAYWGVLVGESPRRMDVVKTVPKGGFETAIRLNEIPKSGGFLQVSAIDRYNRTISLSRAINIGDLGTQSLSGSQVILQ